MFTGVVFTELLATATHSGLGGAAAPRAVAATPRSVAVGVEPCASRYAAACSNMRGVGDIPPSSRSRSSNLGVGAGNDAGAAAGPSSSLSSSPPQSTSSPIGETSTSSVIGENNSGRIGEIGAGISAPELAPASTAIGVVVIGGPGVGVVVVAAGGPLDHLLVLGRVKLAPGTVTGLSAARASSKETFFSESPVAPTLPDAATTVNDGLTSLFPER